MTDEKRYELIDAWLAGELSGKSLQTFEAQLQTDEELAFEVEVVRDLSTLNTDSPRNRLRQTLSEIRNTTEKDKAPIPIYWWLRNAAAALILLVGAIFMINQFSKIESPEFVKKTPPVTLTDEDEDGVIDILPVEEESKKESDIVEEEVDKEPTKKEIDSTPEEQFVDKEKEPIQYKLVAETIGQEVIVAAPEVSSYIDSNPVEPEVVEEYIPDYVSNIISKIDFYEPEHETTFEEVEAEKQTEEEMERINKMANENIKIDYDVVDGDTIEISSAVASAVLYVADVPERRLNFLLESEKEKIDNESVRLDSLIFDTFYENGKMLSFKYEGQLLNEENNQVGFYIFSPNPYDFINNEFLFFEKLKMNSARFSIENQIPISNSQMTDFNLYGVFIDENTEEILAIEKMQIGY